MKRTAMLVVPMLLALSARPAQSAPPSTLEPLSFLLGKWEASGPGPSSGGTEFAPGLQDRVILRTNFADYPAVGDKPATRHDDLMVIYEVGKGVRADYYDNEGHAIRYRVISPGPSQAVFLSDEVPGDPRYRLTYWLDPDGQLSGSFEVAPPDQPLSFKPYLTWKSHKVQAAAVQQDKGKS